MAYNMCSITRRILIISINSDPGIILGSWLAGDLTKLRLRELGPEYHGGEGVHSAISAVRIGSWTSAQRVLTSQHQSVSLKTNFAEMKVIGKIQ